MDDTLDVLPNDPLDDVLRRAMHALDAQVPAGYFEALPAAIDARLAADSAPPPVEVQAEAKAIAARAKRRSMAQTQLGAPHPWWQGRAVAVGIGAVAIVGTVTLLVMRRDPAAGRSSAGRLGAAAAGELRASHRARDAAAGSAGVHARSGADAADAADAEDAGAALLRPQLAAALPVARGCVGQRRPGETIWLGVQIAPSGAIGEVAVRGRLAGSAAERCIAAALQQVTVPPWSGPAKTVTLSLFE